MDEPESEPAHDGFFHSCPRGQMPCDACYERAMNSGSDIFAIADRFGISLFEMARARGTIRIIED